MPRVTIAVPVYNGGIFLRESLECLSQQTYPDFQVVIYNNASTDDTAEISERFVESDKRFRIVHRSETVSAIQNFRLSLADADCAYFAWRAADDLSAPNFIERLAQGLDESSDAWLSACEIRSIKMARERRRLRRVPRLPAGRLPKALKLMFGGHQSWIYCLWRRPVLEKRFSLAADEFGHLWAADHAALFPVLLHGRVVLTDDTYFIQRIGGDERKSPTHIAEPAEQRRIYRDFYRYCSKRIDETDFNPVSKAILRAALIRYTSKRTFRLTTLARRLMFAQ